MAVGLVDNQREALTALGYTIGDIPSDMYQWAVANGGTAGDLPTATLQALKNNGATAGDLPTAWRQALENFGLTWTDLSTTQAQFWAGGGAFTLDDVDGVFSVTDFGHNVRTGPAWQTGIAQPIAGDVGGGKQDIGASFENVTLNQGSQVTSAFWEFTVSQPRVGTPTIHCHGDLNFAETGIWRTFYVPDDVHATWATVEFVELAALCTNLGVTSINITDIVNEMLLDPAWTYGATMRLMGYADIAASIHFFGLDGLAPPTPISKLTLTL
jgi:hypothetical protein